jgi:hypothetical protein
VVESTLRDFKQLDPFVVNWEYPLLVKDEQLNPEKLKSTNLNTSKYTADDLLTYVIQEPITTKELKKLAMEELGISKSFFYELLADLKEMPGMTYGEQMGTLTFTTPDNIPGELKK